MSQFVLRPYQSETVSKVQWFLQDKKVRSRNGLIVLPTGAGKSLVIAELVQMLNSQCVVFQPSKEILEQNYEKLCAYGYRPAVYSASMRRKQVGQVTLATIGSVVEHPEVFEGVELVIVDEAHFVNPQKGMYKKFLQALGNIRVIGLTATPYRLSKDSNGSILKFLTRTRPRVFDAVIHYVQNAELVRDGYWAPLQYKNWNAVDRRKLTVNSTGNDYTDKSVKRHFEQISFQEKLRLVVLKLLEMGRRNIVVFTRFVDESEYLAAKVPGVEVVTADTPSGERGRIIGGFRSGAIRVVANVGVLGIGFDYPELETVVLASPTMSLAKYYQQVGRAVRPNVMKEYALIVDMVGLVEQFGRVEDLTLNPCTNGKWEVETNGKPLTGVYFGDGEKQDFWIQKAVSKKFGTLFEWHRDPGALAEAMNGLSRSDQVELCAALNRIYFGGLTTVKLGTLRYVKLWAIRAVRAEMQHGDSIGVRYERES